MLISSQYLLQKVEVGIPPGWLLFILHRQQKKIKILIEAHAKQMVHLLSALC